MAYAISGTFKDNNANLKPYLFYSYTQDKDNNTSTLKLELKIKKLTSYAKTYTSSATIPYSISVTIDGKKTNLVNSKTKFDCRNAAVGSYISISSKSITLNHNSDGSLKLKISAIFDLTGFNPGKGVIDPYEITLKTIPKQSTIQLTNTSYKLGENIVGTILANDSSFSHKVTLELDNSNTVTYNMPSGTAVLNKTIPSSWINSSIFKDSVSATCNLLLYTYSDSNYSTLVGDVYTTTFTVSIDTDTSAGGGSGVSSYFNFTLNGAIPWPQSYKSFIINETKCKFGAIKVESTSGANIKSIRIVGTDGYDSGSIVYLSNGLSTASIMTPTLTKSGTITYTITATDSRGITATCPNKISITVLNYEAPKFLSVITSRASINDEGNYEESDNGSILKLTLDFDYSKIQNNNLKLNISCQKASEESSTTITRQYSLINNSYFSDIDNNNFYSIEKDDGGHYYEIYWANNFEGDASYKLTYTLTDSYGSASYNDELLTSYFIMDITSGGKSIAFGKSADELDDGEKLMDIAMPLLVRANGCMYEFKNTGLYINGTKANFVKEILNTYSTSATVTLNNETCNYSFKKRLENLSIAVSNSTFSNLYAHTRITFTTSNNTFTFSTAGGIIYIGVDCADKSFAPVADKLYTIDFDYGINNILASVSGVALSASSGGGGGGTIDPGPITPPDPIVPPSPDPGPGEDTNTIEDFPYADDLVATAKTYWTNCKNEKASGGSNWDNGLTYRSKSTPLSGTCSSSTTATGSLWVKTTRSSETRYYKAIDCSTLAGLSAKGYTYDQSPYKSLSKFNSFRTDRLQKNDSVTWSFNMTKEDGTFAREAAAQCEYFDRLGKGIIYYKNVDTGVTYGDCGNKSNDFSPIKKGDFVFYAKKDPTTGGWKQGDRHMKVSHVAICYGNNSSGKKCVIESTNGTMESNHTFNDKTTLNAGVRIVSIAGNYGYSDDIVMVVRPQPIHWKKSSSSTGTPSTGTTEYINCVNETGTIDGHNYIYKLQKCKVTGYGGDSGSGCSIPLNLGHTCGSFNLPYGTKVYIPKLNGKKITDGKGKTATCDGIFTVNDTGVGCTDFDLYMSTASDTNAEKVFGNTLREDVYILSYGSGYGSSWSYTESYAWASKNGTLTAYKAAFKDYIKYGGTLINFLKFKTNDKDIRSSSYWRTLNS